MPQLIIFVEDGLESLPGTWVKTLFITPVD
jgi:hypothetical protein